MKKQLFLFGLLPFLVALFSGCDSKDDAQEPGNIRDHQANELGKTMKVRVAFDSDYLIESEDPMGRADERSTYAGLNVYRKPQKDDSSGSNDASYEYYAYGVYYYDSNAFDALSPGIEINLNTGYIYLFEATILKDGTDKLAMSNATYRNPFGVSTDRSMSDIAFDVRETQNPIYTVDVKEDRDRNHLSQITSGTAYVNVNGDDPGGRQNFNCFFPRVRRFYGRKEYDPVKAASHTVEIDMKFRSFGLMIEVENLPEKSYLTVEDVSDDKNHGADSNQHLQLMFPKNLKLSKDGTSGGVTVWKDAYSLNTLVADKDADLEEKFDLEFTLHKSDGTTKTFSAENVTVHPGKRKNLKINITEQNVNFTGNVVFKMEDEDLEKSEAQESQNFNWIDK